MIRTKADLLKYIAEDFGRYPSSCRTLKARFRKDFHYEVLCYLKLLRKSEYYYNNPSFINKIRYLFTTKRKNIIANRINVYIPINTCGYGLMIYHGDIVINSDARIGNCCSLHGNNCIGNKGTENATCPTIGDHVNIGWGGLLLATFW